MPQTTVTPAAAPNIVADTICRTADLGLSIDDAADAGDVTHLYCRPSRIDTTCPGCGHSCRVRDHVEPRLTDLPIAGHPSLLQVRVPRLICGNDACLVGIFRMRLAHTAGDKQSMIWRVTRWILQRMATDGMSVRACTRALGIGWRKACSLAVSACRDLAYGDPARIEHVRVLGVDEHTWKHVRGDGAPGFVTVIVDLTPTVDGTGPARLLDMVPGRSADAFGDWLAARPQRFRDTVKTVTMDGYSGYAKAASHQVGKARQVMDPFHVVHLAAGKLDLCRQRVQNETLGHRGRKGDPLYGIRRAMLTRRSLVTPTRAERLDGVLTAEEHVAVQVTWDFYQEVIAAYDEQRPRDGEKRLFKLIKRIKSGVPKGLAELARSGRTLWRKRAAILAYFDTGASNGPVEAINGRLEHLRGIALGFRNMNHYISRSLIHSGGLRNVIDAL
ncbi:ISL3 family transposase [Corynebacterium glyciniphilum]|uniref:ISL3 family transposase n=1 Tax=Corynebacterium glyciniphilum TaxID=1404244 RepID=UPI0011AB70D6|nr:ISL3 family transposase [Corynebacterium glyciniphilum]